MRKFLSTLLDFFTVSFTAIALFLLIIYLTSCASLDVYCDALPEEVKKAALKRMRKEVDGYPRHSICDAEGFIIDIVRP